MSQYVTKKAPCKTCCTACAGGGGGLGDYIGGEEKNLAVYGILLVGGYLWLTNRRR